MVSSTWIFCCIWWMACLVSCLLASVPHHCRRKFDIKLSFYLTVYLSGLDWCAMLVPLYTCDLELCREALWRGYPIACVCRKRAIHLGLH